MVKMKRIDAANDTMKEEEKKMNEKMDGWSWWYEKVGGRDDDDIGSITDEEVKEDKLKRKEEWSWYGKRDGGLDEKEKRWW